MSESNVQNLEVESSKINWEAHWPHTPDWRFNFYKLLASSDSYFENGEDNFKKYIHDRIKKYQI